MILLISGGSRNSKKPSLFDRVSQFASELLRHVWEGGHGWRSSKEKKLAALYGFEFRVMVGFSNLTDAGTTKVINGATETGGLGKSKDFRTLKPASKPSSAVAAPIV